MEVSISMIRIRAGPLRLDQVQRDHIKKRLAELEKAPRLHKVRCLGDRQFTHYKEVKGANGHRYLGDWSK